MRGGQRLVAHRRALFNGQNELPGNPDIPPQRPRLKFFAGSGGCQIEQHWSSIGCHPFAQQPAADILKFWIGTSRSPGYGVQRLGPAHSTQHPQELRLRRSRSLRIRSREHFCAGLPIGHPHARLQQRFVGVSLLGRVPQLDHLLDQDRQPLEIDDLPQCPQGGRPHTGIGMLKRREHRLDRGDPPMPYQIKEHRQELGVSPGQPAADFLIDIGSLNTSQARPSRSGDVGIAIHCQRQQQRHSRHVAHTTECRDRRQTHLLWTRLREPQEQADIDCLGAILQRRHNQGCPRRRQPT